MLSLKGPVRSEDLCCGTATEELKGKDMEYKGIQKIHEGTFITRYDVDYIPQQEAALRQREIHVYQRKAHVFRYS